MGQKDKYKAKPYVNMMKTEEVFKKELNRLIVNIEIGESFEVQINGKMVRMTKTSANKISVSYA